MCRTSAWTIIVSKSCCDSSLLPRSISSEMSFVQTSCEVTIAYEPCDSHLLDVLELCLASKNLNGFFIPFLRLKWNGMKLSWTHLFMYSFLTNLVSFLNCHHWYFTLWEMTFACLIVQVALWLQWCFWILQEQQEGAYKNVAVLYKWKNSMHKYTVEDWLD